jgi:hypothetical protein
MMNEVIFMLILAIGVLTVYCCMKFFHKIWNRMEEDIHVVSESDEQKEK